MRDWVDRALGRRAAVLVAVGLVFLLAACDDDDGGAVRRPTAGKANYAVLVGVDDYAAACGLRRLPSCVNDAWGVRDSLLAARGGWSATNVTVLADDEATRAAVRGALGALASRATAGDVVLYYQSSHGGVHAASDAFVCAYDGNYEDEQIAADLARFAAGVRVVVVVDACNSGGLFKGQDGPPWELARCVMRTYEAVTLSRGGGKGADVGWVTACDVDEACWAGDPFSVFTRHLLAGFAGGDRDADGLVSFAELGAYAELRAVAENPGQRAQQYGPGVLGGTLAGTAQP